MKQWQLAVQLIFIGFFGILGCGGNSELFESYDSRRLLSSHAIHTKAAAYREDLKKIDYQNSHLREQNRKLQRYLLGGRDGGCFLKKPVGQLTVKVSGIKAKPVMVGFHHHFHHMNSSGDPSSLTVELAADLRVTVPGNELVKTGSVMSHQLKDHTLGQIQYVKVAKSGQGIMKKAVYTGRGCGFLWMKACPRYRFYETSVWHLSALELWSDDVLIYSKPVDHTFQRATPDWQDLNVKDNLVFRQILARDDCQITGYSLTHHHSLVRQNQSSP